MSNAGEGRQISHASFAPSADEANGLRAGKGGGELNSGELLHLLDVLFSDNHRARWRGSGLVQKVFAAVVSILLERKNFRGYSPNSFSFGSMASAQIS